MDFKEIEQKVIDFRNERNWKQFHHIKDLILGLNIEVAELQELFLWKSEEEQAEIDPGKNVRRVRELAIGESGFKSWTGPISPIGVCRTIYLLRHSPREKKAGF